MGKRNELKDAISNLRVHEAFKPKQQSNLNSERSQSKLSSDQFDLSPFIPSGCSYEFVEKSEGVFQIPHRIFEFIHKVIDSKVELLVFDCLLRFTLGFHRTRCEASQTFIARWTGLASPNVRRALRQLIDQGHVKRVESGSVQHECAVYELPIVVAYLDFLQTKQAKINPSGDQGDLRSKDGVVSDQNNSESEINLIPKKETLKINSNTTLSKWPLWIEEYLNSIQAPRKRFAEERCIEEILELTLPDRLQLAFDYIRRNGDLRTKEPVHSPMAYLATCLDEVLKRAEKKLLIKRSVEEVSVPELEFTKLEAAFVESFPDQVAQNQVIESICKKQNAAWALKGKIARSVAIQFWWDDLPRPKQDQFLQGGGI